MIWKVLLDQEIQCVSRFGNQIIIKEDEEILFGWSSSGRIIERKKNFKFLPNGYLSLGISYIS